MTQQSIQRKNNPSLDHFQGAMLFSAVGDALGWPTEYSYNHTGRGLRPFYEPPISGFVQWQKFYRRWSGYEEIVQPGEYSDDTQLTLAVARCITTTGAFDAERFAYEELPLWLQYERGGGKSVKTAARELLKRETYWLNNFYTGSREYTSAGANGAAMRNLPVALANAGDEQQIIKHSFFSAIVTHGHPRAILGAMLFGLAVNYALTTPGGVTTLSCVEYLRNQMEPIETLLGNDEHVVEWARQWDERNKSTFWQTFNQTRQEATRYLESIQKLNDHLAYYKFVGARNPATRGSGLSTVCAAIYLFLRYSAQPELALATAANIFGSDTDTIGTFLGGLLGAYHGIHADGMPTQLSDKVQDHDYLLAIAERLHLIATNEGKAQPIEDLLRERDEVYRSMLDWENSFFLGIFRNEIGSGEVVQHPTLGRGTIVERIEKPVQQEDFVAKLVRVRFDCGQSCLFRSRVDGEGNVSESLMQDITSALK